MMSRARTAIWGGFAELVAALTPCMWAFCEIGQRLSEGPQPADERYRRWIEMYSSKEFADLAEWCRRLLDRLAEGLGAVGVTEVAAIATRLAGVARWGAFSAGPTTSSVRGSEFVRPRPSARN